MRDTHIYIRYRANGVARKEMVGTRLRDGMTGCQASIIRSQKFRKPLKNQRIEDKKQTLKTEIKHLIHSLKSTSNTEISN